MRALYDLIRWKNHAQLKKADKLRVWLLSILLPKVPPMFIAAVARGSSVTAENLAAMHTQMLDLLHEYGIYPVSLASDGAEAERQQHVLL
ncbi:hypothetical protein DFH09DRAFT_180000 [Mycena vulgaris]|nr:hypothetical protein DFH09DRAFT_180000 [Mycena vulgaris]